MKFIMNLCIILAETVLIIYILAYMKKRFRELTGNPTCPCCGNTYDGTKGSKLIILRNGEFLVCLDCIDTYSKEDIKEKIRKRQTNDTMLTLIVTLLVLVMWNCILILSVEV